MSGSLTNARLRALAVPLAAVAAAVTAGAWSSGGPRWLAWLAAGAWAVAAARAVIRSPEPALLARWPRVAAAGVWETPAGAGDPALAPVWDAAEACLAGMADARRYRPWVASLRAPLTDLLVRAEAVGRRRREVQAVAPDHPTLVACETELDAVARGLRALRARLVDLEHGLDQGTHGQDTVVALVERVSALQAAVEEDAP